MLLARRRLPGIVLIGLPVSIILLLLWHTDTGIPNLRSSAQLPTPVKWKTESSDSYFWKSVTVHNPAPQPLRPLPTSPSVRFPQVQATFSHESSDHRRVREERQQTVKAAFSKAWASYKAHAWLSDELTPVSGSRRNTFGGWAATLVDSLDTLWIMGMKDEFSKAVAAAETINFTTTDLAEVNVFETTIRYLGGFLSAFDLSGDVRLLRKAVEVGEMLYKAFDTPNRMPITRWKIKDAIDGKEQAKPTGELVAEIGSLSMEFTRLSILTGDPKWWDATQRIMEIFETQQNKTQIPGLFPLVVDPEKEIFYEGDDFTLGAMADSLYEYFPKMSALLGGRSDMYRTMWENAVGPMITHNLFRPMTPASDDILIAGQAHARSSGVELEPQGQHLVCFLGGLFALGSKLYSRGSEMDVARKLVDGCIYAYKVFPHGIMPETFYMVPCPSKEKCAWDEALWKKHVKQRNDKGDDVEQIIKDERLVKGFSEVPDRRYILRPEAIESVFVMYRTTGDAALLESAWDMFTSIDNATSTDLANTAVWDVTAEGKPPASDSMESFWMGETLKYFYLIFSEPGLISLDEFVFNTEAHPFRRWK
ncbi:Endoplasmic reticulum mannosyl-oligosaccharide 1,2-alpha-mannosidase [Colletotrichum sp. SAR 10_70]|nr:Endoplasmic reticulum mannosyl-oligosaccharide 1,2-alpha-mannosidase [Colletotrichum sp. SAR 10_71]KAI8179518.1 Endoplasmic reticulum mannosyl-oligosaccharide 1,2-alpha-mannosidase [Colletotrichum sp. SAR 10_70]KAI8209256.1 Endoplasmic reticulum mannosyl-oligosaccharide 1,2-alpha-mannosidase [Colletotrichum sp. SAR 10_76]KAI8230872.1 Endoplasmic reticulum mannosyl-oligosaccharide 1,2-alpha-mannosidase [Colletotrichum sp. SAR 10_86]